VARGGRVDAHVQADVEHGGVLGDRGPQQRAAAAGRVGGEEQERGAGGHFGDAIDAHREQIRGCPLDAQALEDLRRVRVDGVGARHLLADHEPDGDQHPPAVAGIVHISRGRSWRVEPPMSRRSCSSCSAMAESSP